MRKPTESLSHTDYFALAEKNLPGGGLGGYALPEDVRFIYSHGEGPYFWDTEGRRYIDYVCGAGALILGHCPASVVAAVKRQASRSLHMFGSLNAAAVLLSERLLGDIPCGEKLAYTTTGSEATAYAMRLARSYSGRDKILKFEGAYHGNYDYALAGAFPSEVGNYPHAVSTSRGEPQAAMGTMLVAPYNDVSVLRSIFAQHGDEIAAVIVEAVQRIIVATPEFLAAVRSLTETHGALMILDEVVTGFRLRYGGAQELYGIVPDLACYGKVVGGGGALAAVAGRGDIIDLASPRRKGSADYAYMNGTLHGNPIAAVMTEAVLDELSAANFHSDLNAYSSDFCAEANAILAASEHALRVHHCGSLWQILPLMEAPRNQAELLHANMNLARRLDHLLLARGHYILPGVRRFFSAAHDRACRDIFMADLHAAVREL